MLLKADKDDKYSVVKATTEDGEYTEIKLLTTEKFLAEVDYEKVSKKGFSEYYEVKAADETVGNKTVTYRLVNTSGSVQKSKSKAKDGDDRCYKVESNKVITAVFVED